MAKGASTISRRGTMMTSRPASILCRRNSSRASRLARFRIDGGTHLPGGRDAQPGCPATVFHDEHGHEPATDPNARFVGALEVRASAHALRPPERLASAGLAFVGNRQALAPLGAATLQDNPAVLRRHPHPEAMGLGPAAGIRLVGALSLLRSRHLFLETVRRTEARSGPGRNLNSKEERPKFQNSNPTFGSLQEDSGRNRVFPHVLREVGFAIWDWGLRMLQSPVLIAEPGRTKHFGFSPKISTTVENAVEKPRAERSSTEKCAILRVFLRGESAESRALRAFAA